MRSVCVCDSSENKEVNQLNRKTFWNVAFVRDEPIEYETGKLSLGTKEEINNENQQQQRQQQPL